MERLTTKFHNGYLFNLPGVKDEKAQEEYVEKLSMKLGEYEDAEEQGLLLRLPCNVGDKVYQLDEDCEDGIYETQVLSITLSGHGLAVRTISTYPMESDFGKIVFLTREAAEAALVEKGE